MNPVVFDWRKEQLRSMPLVDRPDVRSKAVEYIESIQYEYGERLPDVDIEVVCTKVEKDEVASFIMPVNPIDRMPYDTYAIVKVIPDHIDAKGFEWYKPAIRHELAHIEMSMQYGMHEEDSKVFHEMLTYFDAPLTYKL